MSRGREPIERFRANDDPGPRALCLGAAQGETNPAPDEERLPGLLARMGRVARLYRDLALKFECTESIEFRERQDWRRRSGFVRFAYIYERDANGKLADCRLWLARGRKPESVRCVLPDEYKVPLYLSNAYLFVFAFLDERQPWHEYRIVGEEIVLDRPAVVVEYGPGEVLRAEVNDWFGRAWIDRETSQLLKVEAYRPRYWAEKRRLEEARRSGAGDAFEIESVTAEFAEEMNGLRFVSSVRLRRTLERAREGTRARPLLDVHQIYESYRFFQVASQEEIEGFVEGTIPAPPANPSPPR